jgi:EF hand domain-containing protein
MVTVGAADAAAQTIAADPHHPDMTPAQAAPSPAPGDTAAQGKGAQPGQPGMMPPGMMGQGMMGGMAQPGMMSMPMMSMRGHMMSMRGHMMKVMFAIADVDGALSFEEVTTILKRIFDKVDTNKDGKVTPEEVQAFMRE